MSAPLAIFDVDGTLVDSRFMITAAMENAFTAQGLAAPNYEQTRQIVGLSLKVAIDRLAPREIGPQQLDDLVEGYQQAFMALRKSPDAQEPLYNGAQQLLESLKTSGWRLGIATGKSRRGLDRMIEQHDWDRIFDCHYCADDGAGKPDPFMIHANLNATDSAPRRAVMIGDTSFDMLMSKRAGITAYGVNWGFHTEAEIIDGGADFVFSDMGSLSSALTGFAQRLTA